MSMNAAIALILITGFVLASLPLMGERRIFALPVLKTAKNTWLRIAEFILAYIVWVGVGKLLEAQAGQVAAQGWQFYVVTFLLFVIAAFPMFAWRYLWQRA